ncbi:MAG: guanylate kinase [Candidatus Omnitrophica bacterium]|nr:guanylate kinase [Candidatus Omnitrophota bacterium]
MGKQAKLFVLSAPSGSGKTTLCQKLLRSLNVRGSKKLLRSVSVTTRRPRRGERPGKDYFFISRQEFSRRRKQGKFLEWAQVLDNYYATPREFVEQQLKLGRNVLLSIDVQGARQIKRKFRRAIFIFILPPSLEELERRLKTRSTENIQEVKARLALARWEMKQLREYNYVVLNDRIHRAVNRLREIIRQEGKG